MNGFVAAGVTMDGISVRVVTPNIVGGMWRDWWAVWIAGDCSVTAWVVIGYAGDVTNSKDARTWWDGILEMNKFGSGCVVRLLKPVRKLVFCMFFCSWYVGGLIKLVYMRANLLDGWKRGIWVAKRLEVCGIVWTEGPIILIKYVVIMTPW